MNTRLKRNTAVVTGASKGIGRAISTALGKEGMRVALMARSESHLKETARLVESSGGEGYVFPCDMTKAEDIEKSIQAIQERLGPVDVLVNNAGVFFEKQIVDTALTEWERLIRVNLTAPFLMVRYLLPGMKRQRGGRIINIASRSGTKGYIGQAAYSASKHGLLGFARCLALEAKPYDIHVYTICPGAVRTEIFQGTFLERRLQGENLIEVDDIAQWVLFLLRQPGNVEIPEVIIDRFSL